MRGVLFVFTIISLPFFGMSQNISSETWFPDLDDKIITYEASNDTEFGNGPGGSNVNWDFTAANEIPNSDENLVFKMASEGSMASFFEEANIVLVNESSGYEYYYLEDGSTFELVGYVEEDVYKYEDLSMIWSLPMSFQNSRTDDWILHKYDDMGMIEETSFGNDTYLFDGVGTITTHAGTFSNCYRVRQRRTFFPGEANESSRTTYTWYRGKGSNIVARYSSSPGGNPPTRFTWGDEINLVDSAVKNDFLEGVSMYYDGGGAVHITDTNPRNYTLTILDVNGRILEAIDVRTVSGNQIVFFGSNLSSAGIYFVRLVEKSTLKVATTQIFMD